MIFNQTDHILANGSFTIPDGDDEVTLYFIGYKSTPPTLVLTSIGLNANVNLFVDDTPTSYTANGWPLTIKRSSDVGALTVQWQAIASDPVRTKA